MSAFDRNFMLLWLKPDGSIGRSYYPSERSALDDFERIKSEFRSYCELIDIRGADDIVMATFEPAE